MNQTFSLTRFAYLNRWLWATKGRTYLFGAVALLLVMCLILSPPLIADAFFNDAQDSHIGYFLVLSLFMTSSIGSDIFSALFRQESAITYLMIPASKTEKFWLGTLYCVLALLLTTVVFFVIEAIIFSIANARFPAATTKYVCSVIYYQRQSGTISTFWLIAPAYSLLLNLGVTLLGSFFFRRGVFVRNVGVAQLGAVGITLGYNWVLNLQFKGYEIGSTLPFVNAFVSDKGRYQNLALPMWLTYSIYLGMLLAIGVIARIRFNEIER